MSEQIHEGVNIESPYTIEGDLGIEYFTKYAFDLALTQLAIKISYSRGPEVAGAGSDTLAAIIWKAMQDRMQEWPPERISEILSSVRAAYHR